MVTSEAFVWKTIDSIKSTTPPRAMMIDMIVTMHAGVFLLWKHIKFL